MLALVSAVFVSSTIGTLSNYTAVSSFGTSIIADSDKIRQQAEERNEKKQQESVHAAQNTGELQAEQHENLEATGN
jgi:hypothetical protein